ncbi:hypothetical protein STEG23_035520, partial [Scotinomys teguina]
VPLPAVLTIYTDGSKSGQGAYVIQGKEPVILTFRPEAPQNQENPHWVPSRLTRILKDASMDDDVPDEPADALDEPTAEEDGAKMGDPVGVSEAEASPA